MKGNMLDKTDGQLTNSEFLINPTDEVVVNVDNVSVIFNIANERVENLKEYFIKLVRRELMFRPFVAVDSVSFQVNKGDVFGLIGTNGSGKSTMLKVIAGVLAPSSGSCTVGGSIAPLIELGAGFDMELTAKENIYLNGALLGYSKQFINEHFDEIVDFAELHDFLEMPIKNYSSGMVARMAFAIATATTPDLLIVDEVLSVGDFMFQRKCEDRIRKLIEEDRTTVLIVSHDTDQIERLCNKAVWIEKSQMKMIGDAQEVCNAYRHMAVETSFDDKAKEYRRIRYQGTQLDDAPSGTPMFSIIVPAYNTDGYISDALESCLAQTFSDFEVIVVDDGSSDRTASVVLKYVKSDSRFRLLRRNHEGVSSAKNAGIDAAVGKYIMFLDSDDCLSPDACEILASKASDTDAEVILYGGKTLPSIDWADALLMTSDDVFLNQGIEVALHACTLGAGKVYLRDLVNAYDVRFQTDIELGEDNVFQMSAIPYASVIASTSRPLYLYRTGREGSVSEKRATEVEGRLKAHYKLVKKCAEFWEHRGLMTNNKVAFLEWMMHLIRWDYYFCSFATRKEIAADMNAWMFGVFTNHDIDEMSFDEGHHLRLMLEAVSVGENKPAVSLIVFPDSPLEARDQLSSLSFQSMQNIEIVILSNYIKTDLAPGFKEFASQDERVSLFSGSLAQAIASSLGEIVLIVRSSDEYDHECCGILLNRVREMNSLLKGKFSSDRRVDVLSFGDFAHMLPGRLLSDALPFSSDVLDGTLGSYDSEAVSSCLFSHGSLMLSNKAFDGGFIRDVVASSAMALCDSGEGLVIAALKKAKRVSQLFDDFFELGDYGFTCEDSNEGKGFLGDVDLCKYCSGLDNQQAADLYRAHMELMRCMCLLSDDSETFEKVVSVANNPGFELLRAYDGGLSEADDMMTMPKSYGEACKMRVESLTELCRSRAVGIRLGGSEVAAMRSKISDLRRDLSRAHFEMARLTEEIHDERLELQKEKRAMQIED